MPAPASPPSARLAVHGATAFWLVAATLTLLWPGRAELGSLVGAPAFVVEEIGHAVLFLVLTLRFDLSLRREGVRHALLVAAVASVAYGLLSEGLQELVPERSFEAADLIADGCGTALYVGLILVRQHAKKRDSG